MKKETSNKLKLGMFISLAMVLLVAGIYLIGNNKQLFSYTFTISGVFKDINGLQVGNNVRLSGINVGVIGNIEIVADTAVRVDMVIEEKARKFIKKDSKAIIGSDGLMGSKLLLILPGTTSKVVIKDGDYIETTDPVSIDNILNKLETASINIADITDDLSTIMLNIRSGKGAIGKIFMDPVFAKTVDDALVNVKEGAGGFKQNMDAVSNNFLLRGFLKKKEKEEKKKIEEKQKLEEQKAKEAEKAKADKAKEAEKAAKKK